MLISTIVQATILGILVLIPLIYTEALPKAMLSTLLIAPPPLRHRPLRQHPWEIIKPVARLIQSGKTGAARARFRRKWHLQEAELPPDVINNTNCSGVFGDLAGQGTVFGSAGPAAPPPPKSTTPARIKQGGNVTAASIVTQTRPLYPALARQARIQGNVSCTQSVDKDGKVAQLSVSGHPLLVQAALDAVKQWRYKPTCLTAIRLKWIPRLRSHLRWVVRPGRQPHRAPFCVEQRLFRNCSTRKLWVEPPEYGPPNIRDSAGIGKSLVSASTVRTK